MITKIIQLLTFLIFIAGMVTMGVMSFTHPEVRTTEMRSLNKLPEKPKSREDIKTWPINFEDYFDDHISHRMQMVRYFNLARFHLGISPQRSVVIGKDKWMYGTLEGIIDDYRAINLFSEEELQHWVNYLVYRDQLAKKSGYHYSFIVFPNKPTIYPEYLPYYIQKINDITRFDQVKNAVAKHGIYLFDIREKFLDAKKHALIYNKYDTHWNLRGAEIAQSSIINLLKNDYPELDYQPVDINSFRDVAPQILRNNDILFYAGHIGMLNFQHHPLFLDSQPIHENIFPENLCHKKSLIAGEEFEQKPLKLREKAFFQTECEHKPLRLLVFRDSFFSLLQKFTSESFGYAAYIWARPTINLFNTAKENTSPDIILEERVERYLSKIPRPGIEYPKNFRADL